MIDAKEVATMLAEFDTILVEICNASDDPKILVGPLTATIQMYDDALEWNRRGGGYAGWLEFIKAYYYNEHFMKLDTEGKLRKVADKYFALDLKPYYDAFVGDEPRDVATIAIKRRLLDERLDQLLGH